MYIDEPRNGIVPENVSHDVNACCTRLLVYVYIDIFDSIDTIIMYIDTFDSEYK